jgi:hypothetical protein
MPAPAVTDLNALIAQYQAALKPQGDILDQQIDKNTQSGTAGVAGINAQKDQAFGGIEQNASDKGMAFSGFGLDAQAKYLGGTFAPALANLQSTIEQTRLGLLGKKADLNVQANQSALDQNNREKTAYQQWVADQEKVAAQAAENERQRQWEAQQNTLNRNATAANSRASAAAKAPTAAQQKQATLGLIGQDLGYLFNGIMVRKPGYTEDKILPALKKEYPEFSAKELNELAYAYRKSEYGF